MGALTFTVLGEPGLGAAKLTAQGQDPQASFAEAVAEDTFGAVILALHAKGALTPQVEEAMRSAYESVGNNLDMLGERVKHDGTSSIYARFAKDRAQSFDREFDGKVLVTVDDAGDAFVSAWTWVPGWSVEQYLIDLVMDGYGTLDVLERVGIKSLSAEIKKHGVEAVYQRIRTLIPELADQQPPARPRQGLGG
jgi:hypothetical protein